MVMTINGKQVCDSEAIYGGPGLEGISPDGKPWVRLKPSFLLYKFYTDSFRPQSPG
jgi:hypothetical protein